MWNDWLNDIYHRFLIIHQQIELNLKWKFTSNKIVWMVVIIMIIVLFYNFDLIICIIFVLDLKFDFEDVDINVIIIYESTDLCT